MPLQAPEPDAPPLHLVPLTAVLQAVSEAECARAGDGCLWTQDTQEPLGAIPPRRRSRRHRRRLQRERALVGGRAEQAAGDAGGEGVCNHADWITILEQPDQVCCAVADGRGSGVPFIPRQCLRDWLSGACMAGLPPAPDP